ncbi:MAG: SET domain-containing protein [Parcubacteria group bacterium]
MKEHLHIAESPIAGKGIFADKEFKQGETIYILEGERCSLNEIIRRVKAGEEEPSDPLTIGWEEYIDLDEFSRTFNHSCEPNAYVRGESELVALKDISPGEEITYDYSSTMEDNAEKILEAGLSMWTMECHCGSEKCRGVVDQFATLPEDIQRYYLDNSYAPDFLLQRARQ